MRRVALSWCWRPGWPSPPAVPALADVSTTQQLPAAAGNQGTMNAHERIPEATGTGVTTPGHGAVPGTANVTPCGHGG
jgi:hypothetical protein